MGFLPPNQIFSASNRALCAISCFKRYNSFVDVFNPPPPPPRSNMFTDLRSTTGVLNPWAQMFIPLCSKSYREHFDKISSSQISFITLLNPNAKIFIPNHICNNSKATTSSRNLNTQISRGNFTENSMLNLSPIANNLVTPVLSRFSDDYRENDLCDSTNSNSVGNVASNHSNVENLLDPITILNEIRMKFVKNAIIGHLNINALANKCDALNLIIRDKLNILVLCETKLEASFTERAILSNWL